MKKMKFIIFSSIFLFSIISKTSSYSASYQTSFEKRLSFQALVSPLQSNNKKNYKLSTLATKTENGNLLQLTKHQVKCDTGNGLTAFHLWGETNNPSDPQFGYEFNCSYNKMLLEEKIEKKTNEVLIGDDSTNALEVLENMEIKCGDGSVLKEFKLDTSSDNKKAFYTYNCYKAPISKCKIQSTEAFNIKNISNGKKSFEQLSQFHVQAEMSMYLQNVKFITLENKTKGKFEYSFCNVEIVNNETKEEKDLKDKIEKNAEKINEKSIIKFYKYYLITKIYKSYIFLIENV